MIVFDTETTGLPGPLTLPLAKQPYIIELCAIKLDDSSLEEVDRWDRLLKPPVPLPAKIVEITSITDQMLASAPSFEEALGSLGDFFRGERTMVAHNLSFDRTMLWLDLRRAGCVTRFPWPTDHICTVESTMHLKGRRLKMMELHEELVGEKFSDAHRAAADTEALARCVKVLVEDGTIVLKK